MAENIIEILIEAKNTAGEKMEEVQAESKETAESLSADRAKEAAAAQSAADESSQAASAAAAAQESASTRVQAANSADQASYQELIAANQQYQDAMGRAAAAVQGDVSASEELEAAQTRLNTANQVAADTAREVAAADEDLAAKETAAAAAASAAAAKQEEAASAAGAAAQESSAGGVAAFGKLSVVAVAAGAIVVGAAVDMGEEYQESTAKMAAASGETADQAKVLGAAFLDTAGKSTFSAAQMEAAYGPVAMKLNALNGAVLTTAQSLDVMEAAQNAAEATGQDLNSTTAAVASVMQTYKLSVDDASKISDTLTNASRMTGSSISSLATAMDKLHAKLGPMAPDLQDTGTLVAALAQQGINGSRGISQVTAAFTTLTGGSKATTAELKTLKVNVEDSKGQFVGMSSIIDQLNPKFAKMSQAQQEAASKALFGASSQGALNNIVDAGSDAYDKLADKVNEAGSAHEAAETATDTFKAGMEKLEASGKDLLTMLGNDLMPVVMIVMHAFQQFANVLISAGVWINSNRTWLGLLAAVIGAIAGPILIVVGAIKLWEIATKAFTAVQAALNLVMDANPIMLIVLAIAALVVGVIYAYNHFAWFRDLVKQVWADVSGAFNLGKEVVIGVLDMIGSGFDTFVDKIAAIPGKVGALFSALGTGIMTGLKMGLNGLINVANAAINGINHVTGVVGIPAIPDIPHVAIGGPVSGLALVGENGPEVANFPMGTSISPNSNSMSMLNGGGGGSMQMGFNFTGNTDSALATLLMNLVRTGKIQLTANGKRVQAG